jgi:hypothetical protein
MTATVTHLPVSESRISDYLEDLAREHNSGWDSEDEARALCPLLPDADFPLAWLDFCEQASARDAVARPATEDWRKFLSEDAASTEDEAYELLCQRADEALAYLRTGIRGTR